MKASSLRELDIPELRAMLAEKLESFQNFKFQQALQQLEDGTSITKTRKEIARIKTILKEKELKKN
jgi:large subunit ribosomal protein L29